MRIGIGGDHAGFEYKLELIEFLNDYGHEVKDFGPYSTESVDYPDYAHPLSKAVNDNELDLAVLICGSGNGVSMVANKYPGVRAALCWNEELAILSREHNNANVLSIPARFVNIAMAKSMLSVFLSTEFEGGRHLRRVEKISK